MATTVEQLQLLLTLDDQLSGRLQAAIQGLQNLSAAATSTGNTLDGITIRVTSAGAASSKAAVGIREVAKATEEAGAAVATTATYVGTAVSSYGAMSAAVANAAQAWTVASVAAASAAGTTTFFATTMAEAESIVAGFGTVLAGTASAWSGMSAAVIMASEAWAASMVATAEAAGGMISLTTAMAAAQAAAMGFGGVAAWTATETVQLALGATQSAGSFLLLGAAAQAAEVKLLGAATAMRAALPPVGGGTWAWGDGSAGSSALATQSRFAGAYGGYGRSGVGGGPFSPLGANQPMPQSAFNPISGTFSAGSAHAVEQTDQSVRGFISTMTRLLEIVAVFTLARGIGEMITFAATIETTKIGLAGLVATYSDITTASGQTLQGTAKLNAAFVEADDIQKRLIATEIRTGVSLDTLTKGFLSIYGFGTAVGGTKNQLVDLSAELANLAVSENIPFETLARQMGLAEGGFMRMNSRLGALLKSLNIDQGVLATWRDQGTLVENLVEKLKFFELMGDRISNTWTGAMTTLKTTLGLVLSTGFEPLFEAVKKGIIDTRKSMMTVQPGATAEAAPSLVFDPQMMAKAKEVAGAMADAFRTLMPLLPPLVNLFGSLIEAFAKFLDSLGPIMPLVIGFVNATSAVVDAIGPEIIAVYALSKSYFALAAAKAAAETKLFGGVVGPGGIGGDTAAPVAGGAASGAQAVVIIGSIAGTVVALNAALTGARDLMADLFVNSMKWDAAQFFPNMERAIANSLPGFQTLERIVNKAAGLVGLNVSGPKADAQADTRKAESLENANRAIYAAIRAGGDLMSSDLSTIRVTNELVETYVTLRQRLYEGTIGVDEFNAAMKKAHDTSQLTISAHKEINTKDQEKLADRLSSLRASGLQLDSQLAGLGESLEAKLAASAKSAAAALEPLNHQLDALNKHGGDKQEIDALSANIGKTKALYAGQDAKTVSDWREKADENFTKQVEKQIQERNKLWEDGEKARQKIQSDALRGAEKYQHNLAEIETIGVGTKEDALLRTYARGMEQLRTKVLAAEAGLLAEILGLMENGTDEEMAAAQDKANKLGEQEKRAGAYLLSIYADDSAQLSAARAGDWDAYEARLAEHYERVNGMNAEAARRKATTDTARAQTDAAVTGPEGAAAAMRTLTATVKREADIQREYVLSSYHTIESGIEGVLNGISGGWTGVMDALKSVMGDFTKSFNRSLSEMVTNWLVGTDKMKQAGRGMYSGMGSLGYTGNENEPYSGMGSPGYGQGFTYGGGNPLVGNAAPSTPSSGGFNVYGGAAAGLNTAAGAFGGATGGAQAFGEGYAPYLQGAAMAVSVAGSAVLAGAAATSVVPVVGWIVAAVLVVVGLIINLMAKDTEQHYMVTAGALKLTAMGDLAASNILDAKNGSQPLTAKSAGGQAIIDYSTKLQGSLFDVLMMGAPDQAASLGKAINDAISKYILGINFEVHAGSDEDVQKDFKYLFTQLMPHEMWAKMFGMSNVTVGSQVPGGMDVAGISGAKGWTERGMQADSGPLTVFLTGIGFTMAKVRELAAESQMTDPEVFLTRFKDVVTIAVRINALVKTLAKDSATVWGDVLTTRNASPAQTFIDQAKTLETMSANISSYTGDTQIAKQKELLDLYDKYVEAQKQAITQLLDAAKTFVRTVNDAILKNQDMGKTQDELRADAQGRVRANLGWTIQEGDPSTRTRTQRVLGAIESATTPEQVAALAQATLADLQMIWNGLTAMKNQAESLQASFSKLATNLSLSNAQIWDAANKNPFRVITENIADIQEKLAYSGTLTTGSQAWLDVMQQINTEGLSAFQAISDMIGRIHTAQVSMNQSIDDQINEIRRSGLGNQAQLDKWNQEIDKLTTALAGTNLSAEERTYDQNRLATLQGYTAGYDPKQFIDDLKATIESNKAKLATATTPEEILRLQGLISKDTSTYLGLFNNDNQSEEKKAEARAWATQTLEQARNIGNAAFDAMNAQLTAARNTLRDTIVGIGPIMETAVNTLKDELWHAQKAFERLRDVVNDAYVAMAAAITAPNTGLASAIEANRLLITDTLNPAFQNVAKNANDAGGALKRFADRLDSTGTGGGVENPLTTGPTVSPNQAASYGFNRTLDISRRAPNILRPQQGVFA